MCGHHDLGRGAMIVAPEGQEVSRRRPLRVGSVHSRRASLVAIHGEGFSPLGETGPPKGEEAALPTTLSGLGSCPRSLLDLRGWGVLWGRGFEEAILVQTRVSTRIAVQF